MCIRDRGEVLKDAGVVLDKNDIVEPGLDQKLVAESYQVNIYRARPVVIADGNHKLLVMSAYQTPKLIARHASVELHDEDAVSMRISDNFVRDGASEILTIDRAAAVQLVLYGKHETVYTQAKTCLLYTSFAAHAVPTPQLAEKAAKDIRRIITQLYGKKTAEAVRVLYGGSTSAANAAGFLSSSEIDGLLVGGASLKVPEFTEMIEAAHKRKRV